MERLEVLRSHGFVIDLELVGSIDAEVSSKFDRSSSI